MPDAKRSAVWMVFRRLNPPATFPAEPVSGTEHDTFGEAAGEVQSIQREDKNASMFVRAVRPACVARGS